MGSLRVRMCERHKRTTEDTTEKEKRAGREKKWFRDKFSIRSVNYRERNKTSIISGYAR